MRGLSAVDLNYPDHLVGASGPGIVTRAADRGLALNGFAMRDYGNLAYKAGNQAVEAAAAGARTATIGAVGDDDFGRGLLQNLYAHGIDTSHVEIHKDASSGMSVAIEDSSGDYGAVIVSGANLSADDTEAVQSIFQGARWLLLQNEVPDAANVGAARVARRHGVKTILNAAPSRPFADALKGLIDILVIAMQRSHRWRRPSFFSDRR